MISTTTFPLIENASEPLCTLPDAQQYAAGIEVFRKSRL